MSIENLEEMLNQGILVGKILVGRLGVAVQIRRRPRNWHARPILGIALDEDPPSPEWRREQYECKSSILRGYQSTVQKVLLGKVVIRASSRLVR